MQMNFYFISSLLLCTTLILSAYRLFTNKGWLYNAYDKPNWLYHMQYFSIFAAAYLAVQYFNSSIFLTFAMIILVIVHLYDLYAKKHFPQSELSILRDFSRGTWLFVVIFTLFRALVYDYSLVPSESMEPTLFAGDMLIIDKTHYQSKITPFNGVSIAWRKPQRGDVIVFSSPDNPNINYIKRVIGIAGDRVQYKDQDKIYIVNGESLSQNEHEYISTDSYIEQADEYIDGQKHRIQLDDLFYPSFSKENIDITVPEDHFFVSGDNRDHSFDSRFFGPVHESAIVGKASHRLFQLKTPSFKHWFISFSKSGKLE